MVKRSRHAFSLTGCLAYVFFLLTFTASAQNPVPIQFSAPAQYGSGQVGLIVDGLLALDLNGDSRPDLVVGTPNGVGVMLNKGDGTFLPLTSYPPTPSAGTRNPIAAIDLNGDGFPDLVVAVNNPSQLCVLLNHGDGSFGQLACNPVTVNGLGGIGISSMTVGDFNGDGHPDVEVSYITSRFESANVIFANLGNGTLTFLSTFSAPEANEGYCCGVSDAYAVDVNGDGLADIVTVNNENGDGFSVQLNLGNGAIGSPTSVLSGK